MDPPPASVNSSSESAWIKNDDDDGDDDAAAREIVAKGRVYPALNKYVVFAPQDKRIYIVNAKGCCTDRQRGVDLLEDYCEHRLAVDLFNKAQEAKGQSQPPGTKDVEASTDGEETPAFTEPVVDGRNGKTQAAP